MNSTDREQSGQIINRIKNLYNNFSAESSKGIGTVYAEDIQFIDPFHTIHGKTNLANYFISLAQNLKQCTFKFTDEAQRNDTIFIEWIMTFSHPSINSGQHIDVHGTSVLKTNGQKIIHHRDYFDSGEMLFKHLPVFKQAMHFVTKRMNPA